ncbi:glycosyltransferase [Brevibacterium litoralis]|uniref:glycosyltransferase n=1 Tax=Brevibacterium litoralis TaxID=3138935 RepID=UPI0032F06186
MRIAVLSLHTSPAAQPGAGDAGGLNVYVARAVTHIRAAGHEPVVFTTDPQVSRPEQRSLPDGVPVHVLPRRSTDKVGLVDEAADLATVLAGHPAIIGSDLVWAHYWTSAVAALAAADSIAAAGVHPRPRVAVTFHTIGAVKDRDTGTAAEPAVRLHHERDIAARADLLIANTPAEARDMEELLGASASQVLVAPPGVDLATFTPGPVQEARRAVGRADADLLLLYVGRMQYVKGTDRAIDALATLRTLDPALYSRTRLVMVGGASGGVDTAAFRQLAAEVGVEDRLDLVDPVPPEELVHWYRAADLVLVPSRSESFGFVAAEAQAAGVPVVAASVGGLPHVVDPGRTGVLVPDGSPLAWARTIEDLLRDPAGRTRMGAAAHLHAARFDWARAVGTILDATAALNGVPRDRHHAHH